MPVQRDRGAGGLIALRLAFGSGHAIWTPPATKNYSVPPRQAGFSSRVSSLRINELTSQRVNGPPHRRPRPLRASRNISGPTRTTTTECWLTLGEVNGTQSVTHGLGFASC